MADSTNLIKQIDVGGTIYDVYDSQAEHVLYYNSLSSAISDINNNVSTNAISDIDSAKVKVFTPHTGRLTAMLLGDITESTQIDINKSVDLVLNGKTLSFNTASAYLNFNASECIINGEVEDSTIKKEVSSVSATCWLFQTVGDSFSIIGGTYAVSVYNSSHTMVIRGTETNKKMRIKNCNISLKNTNPNISASSSMSRVIQTFAENCIIEEAYINCSTKSQAQIVYASNSNVTLKNVTLDSVTTGTQYKDSATCVYNNNSNIYINNSILKADAPDCDAEYSYSSAINNTQGSVVCNNSTIFGTHSGIGNKGNLYINGGTYTGFCHGSVYVANGSDGETYINDAVLRCGNYEGVFDYSGKTGDIYGCMYVGGTGAGNNNMAVYLDNCTLGEGGGSALVLRGSSGEQNNTVNISNSTIVDGAGQIRIDNDTLKLNVGTGCNITTAMIDNPSRAEFTNKLYRKNYEDKVLDGNDFNAIVNYSDDTMELITVNDIDTICGATIQSVNLESDEVKF